MIRVTVWSEFADSCHSKEALTAYPNGHHEYIKDFLNKNADISARSATLYQENQGLSDEILNSTDVLIWWGHCQHAAVNDALVEKIATRVNNGMGLICLHSAHMSKPFRRIVGASGKLCWGNDGERERLWVANPSHPIVQGVGEYIDLEKEEMYGEPFGIPNPDELIFNCWYEGGRVFRGGVTYNRGEGKVFYFQPGHETFDSFKIEKIQRVIINAVRWAYNESFATKENANENNCPRVEPIEKLTATRG